MSATVPAHRADPAPPGSVGRASVPTTTPTVAYLGLALAAAVTAAGAVLVREALVTSGLVGGSAWLAPLLDGSVTLRPAPLLALPAAAVLVLGVWLLVVAVSPARSRGVSLTSGSGTWIARRDLARLARATAESTEGVTSARARVRGRTVLVRAVVTDPMDGAARVRERLAERLSVTDRPMTLRVEVADAGGAR